MGVLIIFVENPGMWGVLSELPSVVEPHISGTTHCKLVMKKQLVGKTNKTIVLYCIVRMH